MKAGQVFIEGTWRPSVSGETYPTINPATEEENRGSRWCSKAPV